MRSLLPEGGYRVLDLVVVRLDHVECRERPEGGQIDVAVVITPIGSFVREKHRLRLVHAPWSLVPDELGSDAPTRTVVRQTAEADRLVVGQDDPAPHLGHVDRLITDRRDIGVERRRSLRLHATVVAVAGSDAPGTECCDEKNSRSSRSETPEATPPPIGDRDLLEPGEDVVADQVVVAPAEQNVRPEDHRGGALPDGDDLRLRVGLVRDHLAESFLHGDRARHDRQVREHPRRGALEERPDAVRHPVRELLDVPGLHVHDVMNVPLVKLEPTDATILDLRVGHSFPEGLGVVHALVVTSIATDLLVPPLVQEVVVGGRIVASVDAQTHELLLGQEVEPESHALDHGRDAVMELLLELPQKLGSRKGRRGAGESQERITRDDRDLGLDVLPLLLGREIALPRNDRVANGRVDRLLESAHVPTEELQVLGVGREDPLLVVGVLGQGEELGLRLDLPRDGNESRRDRVLEELPQGDDLSVPTPVEPHVDVVVRNHVLSGRQQGCELCAHNALLLVYAPKGACY